MERRIVVGRELEGLDTGAIVAGYILKETSKRRKV